MSNEGFSPPPYQPQYPMSPPPPPPPAPRRTGRVVGAALLVGALAGGGAGLGGAALYHENSDSSATSSSTQQPLHIGDTTSVGNRSSSASPSGVISQTTEAAAAKALPSVVKIYGTNPSESGSGSGIILTPDGQILTNNHVAELGTGGGKLSVSFNDGSTAPATIVGRDPLTDLAVIQAQGVNGLQPATIGNSDALSVGEQVIAVGSPFGLDSTVTTGVVSALNRPVTTQGENANDPTTIFPAIQTDAAINPGNSGGPLIDDQGNVVGIDSAIRTDTSSTSGQGGSIGLGFAIPINDAIPIVQELRQHQTPTHALIGVQVASTPATDRLGLPDGALIEKVTPGSAGAAAGLSKGDVITKVDDTLVSDADSLIATIRSYRPGDSVTLTVTNSTQNGHSTGSPRTVSLKLGSD
jgi:putative serine protease PepD